MLFLMAFGLCTYISLNKKIKHFPIILFITSIVIRLIVVLLLNFPQLTDFSILLEAAKSFAKGNFDFQNTSDFTTWAYQTGFVIYEGLVLKLFNNVLILKLLNIKYVGCGVLASSVGMDKAYTKIIFDRANINQTKYEYIKKEKENYIYIDKQFNENKCSLEELCKIIQKNLKYPMFVKPSNSGSSVGINKAKTIEELKQAIEYAAKFDTKILVEEGINGKEVECAVLGNEEVIASCVGEIKPAEEFYSFDAKYTNKESKIEIPAKIEDEISEEIRKLAIKAFKAIDGKGLSRVDFFVENGTNKIYINEINTLPGFTKISMYPKLFEQVGIEYKTLLDKLIQLAQEK